jgi:hypothetical protein
VDQMDLAQVGLRRIFGNAAAMFNRHATVRIALNAFACDQADVWQNNLAKAVAIPR